MISLTRLYGRLGNQLFQYAFVRSMAARLGTQFFFPAWEGDEIFILDDADERAVAPSGLLHSFNAAPEAGFSPAAQNITDHTEVVGYFQSEKYYADKAIVRSWFRFAEHVTAPVHKLYDHVDLSNAVSLSLRVDDDYEAIREWLPRYPLSYYEDALRLVGGGVPILVFADRQDRAREFFRPLGAALLFVDDLSAPQQLYLMTKCRANVITNSTFSWWGAWLNSCGVVVCPTSWNRPGVPNPVRDILSDEWVKIPGTYPVIDDFNVWRLTHPIATATRLCHKMLDAFNRTEIRKLGAKLPPAAA